MRANSIDEKEIFNVAIAIETGDARQLYLKQVCGNDADLKRRVDVLLQMQTEEPDLEKASCDKHVTLHRVHLVSSLLWN